MFRCLRWLALVCVAVAGCQSADDVAPVVATPVTNAGTEASASPAAADEADGTATPAAVAAAASFDPPFPHRTELFAPPRGGQSMVRRDEEHGETVELKGFVNVNGPQVVLAIDGVLSPIPEGGEKYGVQVISIHPPSVVLQRGRSRWTASLE